jgi:hypothetical protein
MVTTFEDQIVVVGDQALELIRSYFAGEHQEADLPKIEKAFRFIGHPIKMLHMKQNRTQQERSQAIRLLKYLRSDGERDEYIKMTQPQAAALLEHRPKPVNP